MDLREDSEKIKITQEVQPCRQCALGNMHLYSRVRNGKPLYDFWECDKCQHVESNWMKTNDEGR
jgi:hypothetical protein